MNDTIIFSREKHIGLVTLNRTQALNALTLQMILSLQQQLLAWNADKTIHAVVIRAVPGKAFCAGGDVRGLYKAGRNGNPQALEFFWHEYRLNHFIHYFGKPYIALMDGITMGGGVGISLHGSHPIASERFIFAMPETGIGFFPDIGASHLLSRCPDHFGIYLGLTGNQVGAADAHALGLVKHLICSEQFNDLLTELIKTDLSQNAQARVDACLQRFAMAMPTKISAWQSLISHCFNHDNIESILSALQEANGDWHRDMLTILFQKSPLSLKVTLAQLLKAKSMTLEECLKMDYCLVNHFIHDHDFYEGVRALLVDKDKSPHWRPETLTLVTSEMVNAYFESGELELSLRSAYPPLV